MSEPWSFGWAEVIAIGALAVATAGWLDSVRRINTAAVQFTLEPVELDIDRYALRNTGTKTALNVQIDPGSVMNWEVSGGYSPRLRPQESTDLYLRPESLRGYPDEVLVKFGRLGRGERVIVFPRHELPAQHRRNTQ